MEHCNKILPCFPVYLHGKPVIGEGAYPDPDPGNPLLSPVTGHALT